VTNITTGFPRAAVERSGYFRHRPLSQAKIPESQINDQQRRTKHGQRQEMTSFDGREHPAPIRGLLRQLPNSRTTGKAPDRHGSKRYFAPKTFMVIIRPARMMPPRAPEKCRRRMPPFSIVPHEKPMR
jgi:hypothetical protein